ncbi:MAG: M1 family aminopeptidase [Candidatus Acidiferrales bacterium]
MNRTPPRSLALVLLPVLLFLCAFSCAVPLAPGYRVLKESREVRFVAGQPPELHIRGRFKLENTGNSDLAFVDANFPDEKAFGRKDLRVEVDGREIVPANLPAEYRHEQPNNTLRIPLDPPWARKRTLELVIEYNLASPQDPGSRITLGENDFHLGSRGWFAVLQPPKHLLSPFPRRPSVTPYLVRVPSDFLVLARGTPRGRKKDGGEMEYRFALRQDDLPPYVVAGRYVVSPSDRNSKSAAFWTLQPLKDDPGPAAEEIAKAWNILETDFGPLDGNIAAPHVVESPELREHFPGDTGPAAAAFPGGVLVNPAALALGINSDRFREITAHTLAHNWFGDEMYPSPDAALGMGEGLPEYATIVIDEALNGASARRDRIMKYLREYDEARKSAEEKPLGVTILNDAAEQRRIALAKAPLFFVALEDACGEAPMRSGLRQTLTLLRGQEASYDSLLSALEQSSGKNLGELFRIWLNGKGIPADFRDRYQ